MNLSRNSKIKDLWRHPLGHDILLQLLQKQHRSARWLQSPLVSGLPVTVLDRYAWPGFSRLVLDLCACESAAPPPAEAEAWWKETLVYQIFLPSFMDSDHDGVGDLDGVRQRLPYLEKLGAGVLWLRPVLPQSPGGGVLDYHSVGAEWGKLAGFEALAEAAHARGMRLLISLDIGGVSEEHPWFIDALHGGEKRGYFVLHPGGPDAPPSGSEMAPGLRAWKYFPSAGLWALRGGGMQRMVLDWESPALRQEMTGILQFWLQKGADGFCFGPTSRTGPGLSPEDSEGLTRWILSHTSAENPRLAARLHQHLSSLRASLPEGTLLMGEMSETGAHLARQMAREGQNALDMLLDTSHLAPSLRPYCELGDTSLQDLRRYSLYWMEQGNQPWMSLIWEDANTPRMLGRLCANPLYRSLLAKLLGTWQFTLQGTPVVYQGQELGLSNTRFSSAEELHDMETLRQYTELCGSRGLSEQAALQKVLHHSADHARTPIPWSAGPSCGFSGTVPWMRLPDGAEHLNVACQTADPGSVWQHYQRLIALRRQNPCLCYGSIKPVFLKNPRVLCYFRILGGQKWYVELNLSERQLPRPGRIAQNQKLVLSNYDNQSRALRPYEANLYLCETP